MKWKNFVGFELIRGEKRPMCKWKNGGVYKNLQDIRGNAGLIPAMNGVCVIDLDFVKQIPNAKTRSNIWRNHELSKILKGDTLVVRTPSGGEHHYYQIDDDMQGITAIHRDYYDILVNDSYVVAPGSHIAKYNEYYRVIKDNPIKKIPKRLKKFILQQQSESKVKGGMTRDEQGVQQYDKQYEFNLSEQEVWDILQSLPGSFVKERNKWFLITIALKTLDMKELWVKWSKQDTSKFDMRENTNTWNTVGCNDGMVFYMVSQAKKRNSGLKCYGYYRLINNDIKTGVYRELSERYLPATLLDRENNYMIKSDKGTGKSTCFLHYCRRVLGMNPAQRFISVVSRSALGREQGRKAESMLGIKVDYYKDYKDELNKWKQGGCQSKKPQFQFLITTAESLNNVINDYSETNNCIVFIDEFNSVIEHLVLSDTLQNMRIIALMGIQLILQKSRQFIVVDADISPICEQFLRDQKFEFRYILNKYQSYKGVKVEFHKELQNMVDNIKKSYKKKEKFFIMCDTKNNAKKIHDVLNFKDMQLIVGDDNMNDDIDLNKIDYMVCSPKIVYGLDSNSGGKRKVYGYYNGSTLTPPQMVQQICRERQPTGVEIYYDNPRSKQGRYCSIDETDMFIQEARLNYKIQGLNALGMDDLISKNEDFYCNLLRELEYKKDTYATSNYIHFINCLRESGFNIINEKYGKTCKRVKGIKTTKEIFELKGNEMKEKIDKGDKEVSNVLEKYNLDIEQIKDNSEILQILGNKELLEQWRVWKQLNMNLNVLEGSVYRLEDYEVSKELFNKKRKIIFCKEAMEQLNIQLKDLKWEISTEQITGGYEKSLKKYIGVLNRKYDMSKGLTQRQLYCYLRKVIMGLLPYGLIDIKVDKGAHMKQMYYKEDKGGKLLKTYEQMKVLMDKGQFK